MSARALVIIQAAEQALGNQIALASFDPTGGAKTFIVPLFAASAPDDSTPVAYWCSAQFGDAQWAEVPELAKQFTNPIIVEYDLVKSPTTPDDTLKANNLRRGLSKIK